MLIIILKNFKPYFIRIQITRDVREYDLIAISAGFDHHEKDWGGLLKAEDYFTIGKWSKEFSHQHCQGKRFGVLEGGYNHTVLGRNVKSFLQGFSD